MNRAMIHEFVEFVPAELDDNVLYVSVEYATAVHKCQCGCGHKVVTPLSPRDWKLTFDGETITLDPSIGNWSFECQSHYWIKRNKVVWAEQWSTKQIDSGRENDRRSKGIRLEHGNPQPLANPSPQQRTKKTLWDYVAGWFR